MDGATTTYNAATLVAGTSYTFRVEAIDDAGESDSSAICTAETTPRIPTGLSATSNASGPINLTWDAVAGATSYIVQRSQDNSSWEPIDSNAQGTSYTDAGASAGTTYYYRLLSSGGPNTSTPSDSVSAAILPAPSALLASAVSPSELDLSWSNSSGLATGIQVQMSADGTNYAAIASLSASAASYHATGLNGATQYYFRVVALNGAGRSAYATTTGTTSSVPSGSLGSYEDSSSPAKVNLGMALNFYGVKFSSLWVADDGDLLVNSLSEYEGNSWTPFITSQPVIAPFLGEIDLSLGGSATYGPTTSGGRTAWQASWTGARLYGTGTSSPTNTFSVTLVDRSDVSPGDFDIVFNYGGINWDQGVPGYSLPPFAGYSNGTGTTGTYYELPGSGTDGGLAGLSGTQVYPIRNAQVGLTAYRTGNNLGTAVSSTVQHGGDPSRYLMLVSDQNDPQTNLPFNTETTIPVQNDQPVLGDDGKPLDPDLAKITLHQLPQGLTSGTVNITVSDPTAVKLFDKNGQPLTVTSLNLSSPSGDLAGLTSGDVDVWVEGLHTASDLVIKYALVDANGNDISQDTVHMQIAQWSFVRKDGIAITSVEEDSLQLLQDELTSDPQAPQAADDVYYKIKVDGLTPDEISSVNVQSDTTTADFYSDTLITAGTAAESANWGVIYNTPDANSDLTAAQVQELQKLDDVNAVKDGTAESTLETAGGDSVTRDLQADAPTYDAQQLYTWLTTDPNYGDKVKFLLDRMDWKYDGNTYLKRIVVQDLTSSDHSMAIDGKIYVDTGMSQEDAKTATLDGLREWAEKGVEGIPYGTNFNLDPVIPLAVSEPYFASIARQWARQYYWQIDMHTVPIGETFTAHPNLAQYVGTLSATSDNNAAVESLAGTLDFLYFFSSGASNGSDNAKGLMYSPILPLPDQAIVNRVVTGDLPRPPDPFHVTLPDIYLWVFANRTTIFDPAQHAAYAVNIPSSKGLTPDYFEESTRVNANGTPIDIHDGTASSVQRSDTPPNTNTPAWPAEDQLHHFAGYFYLGAFIQSIPFQLTQKTIEARALDRTGDIPKSFNPGDYDLGLVADDIGRVYEKSPGYSSPPGSATPTIRIWQDLTTNEQQAFAGDGRTTFP